MKKMLSRRREKRLYDDADTNAEAETNTNLLVRSEREISRDVQLQYDRAYASWKKGIRGKCLKDCPVCSFHEEASEKKPGTLDQVQTAAGHGCENCRLILEVLLSFDSKFVGQNRAPSPQDVVFERILGTFDTDRAFTLSGPMTQIWNRPEKYCLTNAKTPRRIADDLDLSVLSKRMLSIASEWLEGCISGHVQCAMTEASFTPRRLVCVGSACRSPYLVEPREKASYAALSYCWGPIEGTLVTKRDNINQHSQAISLGALPKTIQDAILVCRCLNIPYLWVDALCIVQDDIAEQDWYEQSLQMGSIYSHAHVVICAASALACTDGFLPKDDARMIWKQVHHSSRDGSVTYTAACQWTEDYRACEGSIRSSALSQRGWTMQECILPHRLLHFGKQEMIWECDMTCVCECGRTGVHDMWKHADFSLVNHTRTLDMDNESNVHITDFLRGSSPNAKCWVWERLVELYSQRIFTVPGDKLPGVSGLARLFHTQMEIASTEYLAGMWLHSLPGSLLWFVTGLPAASKPSDWRAPSWSWASVDGGVGFFYERYQFSFQSHVQLLECYCPPSSPDDFGRVQRGYLRLRGQLAAVQLVTTHTTDSSTSSPYTGVNGRTVNGRPPKAYPDVETRVRQDGAPSWEVLLDMSTEVGVDSRDCYCLDIGKTSGAGMRQSWLVLRKCPNPFEQHKQLPAFERIGMGLYDSIQGRGPFARIGGSTRQLSSILLV